MRQKPGSSWFVWPGRPDGQRRQDARHCLHHRKVTEGGRPAGGVDGPRLLRQEAGAAGYELGSGWYEVEAPTP